MNGKDEGRPWDAAEYITDRGDAIAFLDVLIEEWANEPEFVDHGFAVIARSGQMTAEEAKSYFNSHTVEITIDISSETHKKLEIRAAKEGVTPETIAQRILQSAPDREAHQ